MNFPEAVNYLYGLGHETLAMKLGLESVRALAGAFDDPQQKYPAVHIAGTNGKGSTAAMTAEIARAAGLRVALYTSPHLRSITERIRVDGEQISEEAFARLASRVRAASERLAAEGKLPAPPTFFEQMTMIAFLHFAECEVDLAVLEVGLGGRLDATNICAPIVTAITPVDFDHQQYLGHTIEEIAGEKAGILKSGVPVVVAPQREEAWRTIERRAAEVDAPVISVSEELDRAAVWARGGDIWNAGRFRLDYHSQRDRHDATINLRGRHQILNAVTAINVAEQLGEEGFPITREAVMYGLEHVEWPGRLQIIGVGEPERPLLLDGAHNPAGASALREFLIDYCANVPLTLLFGAMADKSIDEMAALLFPLAQTIILTKVKNPRAADPATIAAAMAGLNREMICVANVKDALAQALLVTPANGLICACGSLFLVGEILQ
jgi:dihydrofolate synthase/folylpolyglutamate synthase